MEKLITKNPSTGEILAELDQTPVESLEKTFLRAKDAQTRWSVESPRRRASVLLELREVLIDQADAVSELISRENGKPRFEALSNEVLPSVELLSYFAKRAPKLLRPRRVKLQMMKHRKSALHSVPWGVIAVIAPWNYPLLLPFGQIATAIAAGNAVVFKPSEVTPLVGLKIQELFDRCSFPPGLIQTLIGGPELGAAIVQQKPDKIIFTGSVATGKKIMSAASQNLTPLLLELGGKDAMLVLPDADLDFATSAALWGGFTNSGQACASTERLIVHESIAAAFSEKLRAKIALLRRHPQDALNTDLGSITFEKQKEIYSKHLQEAKQAGADFLSGGEFSADGRSLQPTLISSRDVESLLIYREETFGPVIAMTTYQSIAEGVQKVNRSPYGLLASVITRDLALGNRVARQLEVGTVTINEVLYTAGLAETPWGGVKDSGFGRTHSDEGLYELVRTQHIHQPSWGFLTFKSPWWFPYSTAQYDVFKLLLGLHRRSWIAKLKTIPHLLSQWVQWLKKERRI